MATFVGSLVLEKGLRATFIKEFNNAEVATDVMPFIMETTSTAHDESYGWLGQSPMMTEWVDERKLKSLNQFRYSLVNKDFEATLSVDRNEIEDDQLGAINIRIRDLANKAKSSHPRRLFFDALLAGTTQLCYDGQPFFSASHVEGASGTQSNLQTGTGVTQAQITADLDAAEVRMLSYLDDIGQPANEGSIVIGVIVPNALVPVFRAINTQDFINATNNTWKGRISVMTSSARLTDANDWYFADVRPGIKPIIRQIRKPVTFGSLTADSDQGFMRKKFAYGVDSREVFGYGLWQKMIKVTNT